VGNNKSGSKTMTDVASPSGTKTNSHVANYKKTKIVASNPFDVLNMVEKDVGAASSGTVSSKGDMADVNVGNNKDVYLDNEDSDSDVNEDTN
ncbi:hypothetical protein Tco_1392365, partial [Tanacetum coccineum]